MRCVLLALSCLSLASAKANDAAALEQRGAKVTSAKGVVTAVQAKAADWTRADYVTLGRCTGLKRLTISGKTLTDETLALLSGLTQLEELSTDQSALSDDGYKHFAAFRELRRLSLFHPSWASKAFTGKGLAHLKELPKLERLTFAGSTAGDEALEAVGRLTQLKEFSTWHTAQTQAGNAHLLNLTGLTALKVGQRLPPWGKALPASFDEATVPTLAKMKSLERLELFEARLTAKGLAPLAALPNLKELLIHTTEISADDVKAVRAALPRAKVTWTPLTDEQREETLRKKLKL